MALASGGWACTHASSTGAAPRPPQGPSSLERRASLGGPLQRTASLNLERTPYGLVCTALVQRSVELLGHLRASAHPPNGLQHVVIARLGEFHPTERSAWEQILADRPLLLPDVSSSHRMAVVGLQAAPPARWGFFCRE